MALIALGADKGSPGVTTTALALAAIWPRGVLVAECDTAGGDLVYRLPAEGGGRLNPARGLLSLAATARRGLRADQVWEHTQQLAGGLPVLPGLTSSEQATGLGGLWRHFGRAFATLPHTDVLADCGRIGPDGPQYDMFAEADIVLLLTRATLEEVVRLRERLPAIEAGLRRRGRATTPVGVVVVTDAKRHRRTVAEVVRILNETETSAAVLGGMADDPRGAALLRGEWGARLDRTVLIGSARQVAGEILGRLAGGRPNLGSQPVPPAPPTTHHVPTATTPVPPGPGTPSTPVPTPPPAPGARSASGRHGSSPSPAAQGQAPPPAPAPPAPAPPAPAPPAPAPHAPAPPAPAPPAPAPPAPAPPAPPPHAPRSTPPDGSPSPIQARPMPGAPRPTTPQVAPGPAVPYAVPGSTIPPGGVPAPGSPQATALGRPRAAASESTPGTPETASAADVSDGDPRRAGTPAADLPAGETGGVGPSGGGAGGVGPSGGEAGGVGPSGGGAPASEMPGGEGAVAEAASTDGAPVDPSRAAAPPTAAPPAAEPSSAEPSSAEPSSAEPSAPAPPGSAPPAPAPPASGPPASAPPAAASPAGPPYSVDPPRKREPGGAGNAGTQGNAGAQGNPGTQGNAGNGWDPGTAVSQPVRVASIVPPPPKRPPKRKG